MARPKSTEGEAAGLGHNGLNEDEQRALLIFHFDKIRQQQARAEAKKGEYDAERDVLTDLFRVAKADGFTRKELTALLADTAALRRDLTAEEERRAKLRGWLGLPVGTQLDLFSTPLEIQDAAYAKGQGYAAGLRGADPTLPENMQARFAPDFMAGWHKGQEELAWALAEGGKIVDRRANANSNPVALQPEPDDEEEEEDELDSEAIDDEARRLKRSGWAEQTPAEAEFVEA